MFFMLTGGDGRVAIFPALLGEAQRRQPPRVGSAPASGVLPSFGFPTNSGFSSIVATPSINLTDFGHLTPLLLPDSFPGASQPVFHSNFSLPASWDAAPFSWPAQFSQQPSTTPRYSHTGVILFPANVLTQGSDEYSSSRFPSAPPSSIPDDDGWSSRTAPASSNKRQKKLEDPLGGWVMQDPDTGEKLTGHEWVKCYPEEFAERYKKDHRRYIEYLAQAEVDS
ncbi:hypothetical protein K438DRAFT_1786414 [Mycena galopus ATCC 62051]|nr:hypothetical protein K438DRAFT_1786414 [Mycena galopus ATCC 62051]